MNNSIFDDYWGEIGIDFPKNEAQLNSFNKQYCDYSFEGNINAINPSSILKSLKKESKVISGVDYHKRTILAAEIVYQLHKEFTMGHLKLQKLIYLCEQCTNMQIHTNFLKQAMGPFDPHMMRSIDKQLKKNKWFNFTKNDFPLYKPLDNIGSHKIWYDRYFEDYSTQINFLIETFRKSKSDKVELVATIYACWLEAIDNNQIVSENLLLEKVYKWSKEKIKFPASSIQRAIKWMDEKGIKPSEEVII
ncbi:hypothetical protein [Marinifilum caeruleilacunae]|uniref:Uncharacterized protein n=1 Tax=Marinifilum caeruleilacunae TaxID=2499076 RepID=A0ABX1WS28_9BACT|nr:hypothetical protein [Marinifilum caeruleilacunae]NOU58890.1 hypothetical protein [Marinifilum caeruleilacunae]